MEMPQEMEPHAQPNPDLERLIGPIGRAVDGDRVTGLARVVTQLEAAGAFEDPALYPAPRTDRYARRLIWRDPDERFVVVGVTWQPGQASPLHDHAGLWGVEIVVQGTMEEQAFRLVDRDALGRYRFHRESEGFVTRSSVGILLPPLEYHTFRNAGAQLAHTFHVYGGTLDHCRAFVEDDDGWWRGERVALAYDA
jgi:predicted metal-dependent enzyme (double-stranded beta helix superfamily)